jgi:sodium/bile acid cotransporter 7
MDLTIINFFNWNQRLRYFKNKKIIIYKPDTYTLALFGVVVLATVQPSRGFIAQVLDEITNFAIALLFFLHGARLSRQAVIEGATHWRLHLMILATSFVLFPVLGLLLGHLLPMLFTPALQLGILFVCLLPSTVQSSIAFTSIAGGNVPAAICAAALSNLLGIVLTPLLVSLLMSRHGVVSFEAIWHIMLQLLLPFLAGQSLQPWLWGWIGRHYRLVSYADRGSILLIVYTAFSAAVVQGIWQQVPPVRLALLILVDGGLLGLVLLITTLSCRLLGFRREDEIAIVFCGSKKSLASGAPMAKLLFAGPAVGLTVLPLMIFHQMQLMVCAALARRYASAIPATEDTDKSAMD